MVQSWEATVGGVLEYAERGLSKRRHCELGGVLSGQLGRGLSAQGRVLRDTRSTARLASVADVEGGFALLCAPLEPEPGQIAELDDPGDGVGGNNKLVIEKRSCVHVLVLSEELSCLRCYQV